MTTYTKITDYAAKDSLLTGNPSKVVRGTEIDAEFTSIASADADSVKVSGLGANVAAFLATPSSANLAAALTDETGTGANVFANSPTLVTPALGTPSSGTLTSCTGLPVATGISGLGTGIATALAVNVGTAGSPVVNGGALGTPSSGTVTNLTGTASININGTVGATTPAAGTFTTLTSTGNSSLGDAEASDTHAIKGATTLLANSASAALTVTQTGAGNAFVVEDSASTDSTPFVIDASGRTVLGNAVSVPVLGVDAKLQNWGDSGYQSSGRFSNDSFSSWTIFVKSRNTSVGGQTAVQSGDELGNLAFTGSDGTAYIQGARIRAEVDGTPGTNDMPGRLMFSTTADGASSPTERMRIDSSGQLGFPSVSGGVSAYFSKNLTGATTGVGIYSLGQVQSDVTTGAFYFRTFASTAAAAFTVPELMHYDCIQSTIGAGSTVTTQVGFNVRATLTGATNNYGFYGNIPAGTNRWNLYMAGTANNYLAGSLGVGGTPVTGETVRVGKNLTGASTVFGVNVQSEIRSDVTASAYLFTTYPTTQATAFTLSALRHFSADQGVINAGGSSVTNQYGFRAEAGLTGATNNYGFYGAIAAGTNRYNFYAAGTAANYFNGPIQSDAQIVAHGATAIPAGGTGGAGFRLSTTVNFGVFFGSGVPTLSAAQGSLYLRSDGSSASTRLYVNTNGTTGWEALASVYSDGVGYLNIPQNSQSAPYTLVLGDAGKHILHPSADTTARTITIPANASVAFPLGTAITFVNQASAGVMTIAITTDTMRLAGAGTTGSRTLAANGVATAIKLTSTEWIISGTNLT